MSLSKGEPLMTISSSAPDSARVLAHVGEPHILADLEAEPHALVGDRAGRRPGCEDPFLVEHAVVRQLMLEADGGNAAFREEQGAVVELALPAPGRAQDDGGSAVGRLLGQRPYGAFDGIEEGRLQHQILGRVAGDHEFRCHKDIRPEPRRLRARRAQLGHVARDVADDGVELRQRDGELIGHGPGAPSGAPDEETKLLRCERKLGRASRSVNRGLISTSAAAAIRARP